MRRIGLALAMLLGAIGAQAATFTIDPAHSSVTFKVKHVVGKVTGKFDKFSGTFNYDAAKPDNWSAQASIDANSVDTGIEKRDNHLKSPDFFDATKYPTLTFKSTSVTGGGTANAKLNGDLTIHGVTKPVSLDLSIEGVAKDPMSGGQRAGATATTHVKREDFGVRPTTGPIANMVGDDIEITIEIEGVSK